MEKRLYLLLLLGVIFGCSKSDTITVMPKPTADFSWTDTNGSVQFTNNSKNADSYQWDFGDNIGKSTSQNPKYTFEYKGNYQVKLTAKGAGGETEAINTILVTTGKDPAPIADFTWSEANGVVAFINKSQFATSYSWDFGDGSTKNIDVNPKYTFKRNQKYNVILTANGKGGTNSKTTEIEVKNAPIIVPTNIYITKISITDINPLKISSSYKTLKVVVTRGSAGIGNTVWESNEFSSSLKSGVLYDLTNNKLPLLISQPSQDYGFALQGFSYFSYDTIMGTVTKTIGETLKSDGYPLKRKSGCAACDIEFEIEFKYEY
jgi:PKD repeat protein